MVHMQNIRAEVLIKQEAATNAATLTSDYVDTRGYKHCLFVVHGTTSSAATTNPATLKVTESNDTVASNFADITALVGDGAGGFTIPNSPTATTTAPFAQIAVNLLGQRKRYLKVLVSPTTTQTFSVLALLSRAEEAPVGTTEQNAAGVFAA